MLQDFKVDVNKYLMEEEIFYKSHFNNGNLYFGHVQQLHCALGR